MSGDDMRLRLEFAVPQKIKTMAKEDERMPTDNPFFADRRHRQTCPLWLAVLSMATSMAVALTFAVGTASVIGKSLLLILSLVLALAVVFLTVVQAHRSATSRAVGVIVNGLSRMQNLLYAVSVRVAGAIASNRPALLDRCERRILQEIIASETGSFLICERAFAPQQDSNDHQEPWRLFFLFLEKIVASADLRDRARELVGLLDLLESIDERQIMAFAEESIGGNAFSRKGSAIREDTALRVLRTRAAHTSGQIDREAECFIAGIDRKELEAELEYLGEDSLERRVYEAAQRQAQENPDLRVVLAGVVGRILEGRRARESLFAAASGRDVQSPKSR